jgi:glycosyltransferase involved in cell wall biosynthesis
MVLDANDGRGMFRHGYVLAQELSKKGHDIVVAYIDQNEGVTEEDGVKVYKFAGYVQHATFLYSHSSIRHHGPMPDGMAIRKLDKIISDEKPDLIHVHGWVLYSVASLRKSTDVPIVATLHDYGYFCPTKILLRNNEIVCNECSSIRCLKCGCKYYGPFKGLLTYFGVNRYFRLLKSDVDQFIAVSSYVKQRYVAAGFLDDKVTLIPNFHRFDENELEIRDGDVTALQLPDKFILFVGALSHAKGVNVLIDAYEKLHTDVKLVLIGLKQSDFTYKLDKNIVVLENQPHDMVMKAWQRCLFGVVPSIWPEPCPTVAFEAMSCRKALVASGVGGLQDIVVHGVTGYLYPPFDEQALMKYMIKLIENRTLAEEMGLNGYKKLNDCFRVERVVNNIQSVYNKYTKR